MADITAALVKELRELTGVGMMDCKKALNESGGEIDAAVDWLRKQGLSAAAKKAGRAASEGLVGIATDGKRGAIVEINAETDFVARNETFQEFVVKTGELVLGGADNIDALKAAAYPGGDGTVADEVTSLIATIGENLDARRCTAVEVSNGVVASYMHNVMTGNLGRIGVLVGIESDGDAEKLAGFGKQMAMHIAAAGPTVLAISDVDPADLDRERTVLSDQARESGKPEEIIEKMVEGRLRKYYEEVCLLEQTYVIDNETKISKAVEAFGKEIASDVKISAFVRFALGEGVEKKEEDFAAEVAATLNG